MLLILQINLTWFSYVHYTLLNCKQAFVLPVIILRICRYELLGQGRKNRRIRVHAAQVKDHLAVAYRGQIGRRPGTNV